MILANVNNLIQQSILHFEFDMKAVQFQLVTNMKISNACPLEEST